MYVHNISLTTQQPLVALEAIVEIDESKIGRRKYNRGRYVEGHWVFGGIEQGTGECFMVEVPDRSAATLLPIIFKHVRPSTTIISDKWRAYSSLASSGMIHLTVNYSLNFINPINGAHTQSIESTWSQVKRMMRSTGVMNTSSELFSTYLQEFLWRRKFNDTDHFESIIDAIKEQYPL
uniref:ISXO2-like transposase domain-containing protein n=1 Tax=Amphimedon queenslandica TaxID=400682 RepID=A0A1X7VKF1_AMPQE